MDKFDLLRRPVAFDLILLRLQPPFSRLADVCQGFLTRSSLRPASRQRGKVDDVPALLARFDDCLQLHTVSLLMNSRLTKPPQRVAPFFQPASTSEKGHPERNKLNNVASSRLAPK